MHLIDQIQGLERRRDPLGSLAKDVAEYLNETGDTFLRGNLSREVGELSEADQALFYDVVEKLRGNR